MSIRNEIVSVLKTNQCSTLMIDIRATINALNLSKPGDHDYVGKGLIKIILGQMINDGTLTKDGNKYELSKLNYARNSADNVKSIEEKLELISDEIIIILKEIGCYVFDRDVYTALHNKMPCYASRDEVNGCLEHLHSNHRLSEKSRYYGLPGCDKRCSDGEVFE